MIPPGLEKLYNLPNVDAIMRAAKFPGGVITPPATFKTAAPVKGPGFFERASDFLMPGPQGMQEAGLLTDEDIKNAQRQGFLGLGASLLADSGPKTADQYATTGQALGRGIQAMQGTYKGAVDSAMQMRAGAEQFKGQQLETQGKELALAKAKNLSQARQNIISKYPMPNDPTKMPEWLETVLPHFIAAEDDETVNTLGALLGKLKPNGTQAQFQQTQVGDAATTFDPRTGKFFDPKTGTWQTSVSRGMNPDELELKRLQLAEQRARTGAMTTIAGDRQLQSQSNAFMTRNKDTIDRAGLLKQALTTLRDSQHDPGLYTSAVANFIQAADQKAQIRWQLLKYFKENVDPSIAGKWETLKARMLEGKLPGYVSDSMIRHLSKLLAMSTEEFERRRSGEIKRHPNLEGWIPPSEEIFSEGSFGPGGSNYQFGGHRPSLEELDTMGQ